MTIMKNDNFRTASGQLTESCRIKKPKHSGSEYFADADKKFIVVEVGGRGKQSDGGTFHYSRLNKQLENHRFNMPPPQTLPAPTSSYPWS